MNYSKKDFAIRNLQHLGYEVEVSKNEISFIYNGHLVKFFPKKQWATGKSIKDGRGLNNLLNQLEAQ